MKYFVAAKCNFFSFPQGTNLHVKNLDPRVTDQFLQKQFQRFGKITSAKVGFNVVSFMVNLFGSISNKDYREISRYCWECQE